MSAKANYFKLGLFILMGVALIFAGVLIFGAGKIFEKRLRIETYVNESVQGIDIGSKVKFRGVTIGNVSKIDFTSSRYEMDRRATNLLSYVRIECELDRRAFGSATEELLVTKARRSSSHSMRTYENRFVARRSIS